MPNLEFCLRERRHPLDPHLRRPTYTIEVPKHSQRVTHMLEKHLTSGAAPFFETVLNFDTYCSLQMTSFCTQVGTT